MTWIKPSFTWVMHRSCWGSASGQERVLAVRLCRAGFAEALAHACLSSFHPAVHDSYGLGESSCAAAMYASSGIPNERGYCGLPYRTIQIGLTGHAVTRYVGSWICDVSDVTELAHAARDLVCAGQIEAARALVPTETEVFVGDDVRRRLGMA